MLKSLITTAILLIALAAVVVSLMPQVEVDPAITAGVFISLTAYASYFTYFEEL